MDLCGHGPHPSIDLQHGVGGEAGHDKGVGVVGTEWNFNGVPRVGTDGEGVGL